MRNTGVWPAIVLAALALAALPARAGSQEDVAQMQAGTRAWTAAYNAGRVEPILALYGPDAVVMPPDAPLAAGADAIRAWATADVAAAQAAHLRILPTEGAAGVAGDLGWNSGVFKPPRSLRARAASRRPRSRAGNPRGWRRRHVA